jgi:ribulose-5-phosphate 4-epimerase/fuculose-1-phosphate aldolase
MRSTDQVRHEIVAVCQRLYPRGFIAGTEGNVSVRLADIDERAT